ncbi:hypothetical protein PR048_003735 [Dryococelus australis]|uniref:Uncharacterized protein n=1 Tax=Dryococelus australis TaxID=614101 RepID=A0ABQ9IQ52_9NEOP|nr:hypothetical protein PR048_003735 [Dryococelus australis]
MAGESVGTILVNSSEKLLTSSSLVIFGTNGAGMFLLASWSSGGMQGRGKWKCLDKTDRPTSTSATFPKCKNLDDPTKNRTKLMLVEGIVFCRGASVSHFKAFHQLSIYISSELNIPAGWNIRSVPHIEHLAPLLINLSRILFMTLPSSRNSFWLTPIDTHIKERMSFQLLCVTFPTSKSSARVFDEKAGNEVCDVRGQLIRYRRICLQYPPDKQFTFIDLVTLLHSAQAKWDKQERDGHTFTKLRACGYLPCLVWHQAFSNNASSQEVVHKRWLSACMLKHCTNLYNLYTPSPVQDAEPVQPVYTTPVQDAEPVQPVYTKPCTRCRTCTTCTHQTLYKMQNLYNLYTPNPVQDAEPNCATLETEVTAKVAQEEKKG